MTGRYCWGHLQRVLTDSRITDGQSKSDLQDSSLFHYNQRYIKETHDWFWEALTFTSSHASSSAIQHYLTHVKSEAIAGHRYPSYPLIINMRFSFVAAVRTQFTHGRISQSPPGKSHYIPQFMSWSNLLQEWTPPVIRFGQKNRMKSNFSTPLHTDMSGLNNYRSQIYSRSRQHSAAAPCDQHIPAVLFLLLLFEQEPIETAAPQL